MPTPLDILLDPVSLTVLAMYAALMLWENVAPARSLPRVKHWRTIGLSSFIAYFYLSSYLPLLWDGALTSHRLFDLTGWPIVLQIATALLVYELGAYIYHRAIHASRPLWLAVHQGHHAAERLDTVGAFLFSPLDMIGWTLLGSFCLVFVVGLSAPAATATLLLTTFLGIFQHANVRTPRWLGYLIQRPESHAVHHARGVHARNYSDLPIFDLLFGTFENPKTFAPEQGFGPGSTHRLAEALLGRDVSVTDRDARPVDRPSHMAGAPR